MRLGLVVESDPDGRCSMPVGDVAVLVAGETFVIGRVPDANLIISADHMNRRNCGIAAGVGAFVLTDFGGTNGVFVNRERVESHRVVWPGDTIDYPGIVLRFVDLDPLSSMSACGAWMRLGTRSTALQAGHAFRVAAHGVDRGWLVTDVKDTGNLAGLAAAAKSAGLAVVDEFDVGADHAVVFAATDFVDVRRLALAARPIEAPVALAILLRLSRAQRLAHLATGRDIVMTAGVSFAGDIVIVPRRPLDVHGRTQATRSLAHLVQSLVFDEPAMVALQRTFATVTPTLIELDSALWQVAHTVGVASNEELAGVVTGLFDAEARAAALLDEQLRVLTPASLAGFW